MIKTYFKAAWRNIRYQRVTSMINIAGLAIGMWAAILISIWVQNELSFDEHYKDAKDIFLVKEYVDTDKEVPAIWESSPYLLGEKALERIPEVLKVARIAPQNSPTYFNIKGQFIQEDRCAYVDSSWFNVFDHEFISGSPAAFNKNPFSLLITRSKAKKYFGNENPVGQTMRIDTIDYRVEGLIADNPANSSFQYDIFIPLAARATTPEAKKNLLSWGNYNYLTFIKLLPTADPVTVEKKLSAILLKERNREKNDMKAELVKLPAMHFEKSIQNPSIIRGDKKTVTIFSVLLILLLTIACINYVNLTTARATLRIKEVSIRKIVGAARRQLFAQFITESFMVSLFALIIAVIGIRIALPYFNNFTEKGFIFSIYSARMWMILGGTLFVTVIISSIYPALLLSSFQPLAIFRGANIFKIKSVALRKVLVITQFTLSIVLIVASIVIYRQMQFINNQSSTINRSEFFSFTIPYKVYKKYTDEERTRLMELFKQQMVAQSSIANVSRMSGSVIDMRGWSSGGSTDWDGRNPDFQPRISFFETDSSFKNILNLKIAEGRWFHEGTADMKNSILNETAVKEFNIHQPVIGQRFISRGDTGIVIGVVKDFFYKTMHEKIGPVVISNNVDYSTTFLVKTVPGKTIAAKDAAEKIWKSFFPVNPFPYKFLDEEFETLYRAEQKVLVLVRLFSFLAIVISCLGLFGLAAFTAERRKKEIGIRKVVGASVTNIVTIISKEFIALVAIAFLIASPLAWWAMDTWLKDFAYRINIAWWMFITAGAITIIIAVATMSYHAVKAALKNPVTSLRSE
jgi:putative ABC transport system permease protein